MRYCSECGNVVEDNVQVCPSCGCQIKDEGLNNGMYMNSYSAMPEKKKTNKALVIVLPILIIALLVGGLAAYKFVYLPKKELEMEINFDRAFENAKDEMVDFVNSAIHYGNGTDDKMSEYEADSIKAKVDGYYEEMEENANGYNYNYELMKELYDPYEEMMYVLYDYDGYWWDGMDRLNNAIEQFKDAGAPLGIEEANKG